ncbi:MAG: Flp pilus assembly protein CpaB [Asticcacaulis sp.]
MKTSRYVVMGIAAAAAILLAFLVRGMIAGKATTEAKASIQAPAPAPTQRVLVAAHEIKAGSRLAEADLTWQDWPVASLNPAYIVDGAAPTNTAMATPGSEGSTTTTTATTVKTVTGGNKAANGVVQTVTDKVMPSATLQAYVGGVAREDILANEPIIDAKIVRADEGGFMAVMLNPGMRAMAVPVSVDNTAGGFILPGDHVDILVTHQTQKSSGGTIDSVQPVLRNIRVLAIDQQVSTDKDKQSVIGATATLEVSPEDGQAVTLAKASGTLSLMLRSYADVSGPSGVVNSRPVGSEADNSTVRVFRNGQTSEVMVSR